MTQTASPPVVRPQLHLPSEPLGYRDSWRAAVADGVPFDTVVSGVADWLWSRWRAIERAGMGREAFEAVVTGYRRELWLWLAGERTWEQCCSGLLGRIGRRYPD